jgi:hypothetical protein
VSVNKGEVMELKKQGRMARLIVWLVKNEPMITGGVLVVLALALVGAVERGLS